MVLFPIPNLIDGFVISEVAFHSRFIGGFVISELRLHRRFISISEERVFKFGIF